MNGAEILSYSSSCQATKHLSRYPVQSFEQSRAQTFRVIDHNTRLGAVETQGCMLSQSYREPWPVAPANEPPSGWAPVAALAAQPAERARVMVHMPAILKPETTDSHPTFGTAGGVRACLPARPGAAARHGRTGHGPAGPGHWLSGLQGAAPGRMAVVVTVR